jgi:prepilin-type N-terminal cleavage/methylation domain-containing protein
VRVINRTSEIQCPRLDDERGFTLIEMVVALAIGAIAFAALGTVLVGGLKAVAVQKTRSRANDIATQGIEDLQRFDYNHLGLCTPPPGTAPAGLSDTVFLPNCTSPTYEQPCPLTTGTVPASSYTCPNTNIQYSVRRYVAWADSSHAVKRLAVFVDWTDTVGNHEVAQQSSLRAPDAGSVVGLSPPSIGTISILVSGAPASSTNPVQLVNGIVASSVTFQASATGIPDSVVVAFSTLVNDQPTTSTLPLTTSDNGATWSAVLPSGSNQFTFGAGTQYITFVAARSADGKVNSLPSTSVVTFVSCQSAGVNCSAPPSSPAFTITGVNPTSPHIDSSGTLCAPVTVTATTTNTTTSDTVNVSFATLNGPNTVQLTSTDGLHWSGALLPSAGYQFASGATNLYLTAAQAYDPTANPPEYGSTAAVQSPAITFGGSCP